MVGMLAGCSAPRSSQRAPGAVQEQVSTGKSAVPSDGPHVIRTVTPLGELLKDARLAGRMEVPPGDALPPGVVPRTPGQGLRFLSLNIHMFVPNEIPLPPANERLEALRDIARYINSVDPDVVILQEVRFRPYREGQEGLGDSLSTLAHLVRAADVAFTPAVEFDPLTRWHKFYGTAIVTRNAHRIERAVNALLPNAGPEIEPRGVGIAAVVPPRGKPFTVFSTHLAHRAEEDAPLRAQQLAEVARIAEELRTRGTFHYEASLGGGAQEARDFPREALIVGGDLNQTQAPSDAALSGPGLTHVNGLLAATGPEGVKRARAAEVFTCLVQTPRFSRQDRIDHVYAHGLAVRDVAVVDAVPRELEVLATDHKGVIVDFILP